MTIFSAAAVESLRAAPICRAYDKRKPGRRVSLMEVRMIHISHILVLAQSDFVEKEVGSVLSGQTLRRGADTLRKLLARL